MRFSQLVTGEYFYKPRNPTLWVKISMSHYRMVGDCDRREFKVPRLSVSVRPLHPKAQERNVS